MTVRKKVTKTNDLSKQLKIFINLAARSNNTPEEQVRFDGLVITLTAKIADQRMVEFTERAKLSHGSFDDWYKWATSLYHIVPPRTDDNTTANWKTFSHAAEWTEEMSWELPDEISCFEKIEQLIDYKEYDRKRGRASGKNDMASKS